MSNSNTNKDRRMTLYKMSNKVDTAIWELLDFIHDIGCQGGFEDNILNHNLRNNYIPLLRNVSDHICSMIEEFDLNLQENTDDHKKEPTDQWTHHSSKREFEKQLKRNNEKDSSV